MGSGVDPSRSSTFLKLSTAKLLVFKWSLAQVYFFKNSYEVCCVCYYGPALLRFCFQTNLKCKNSASYLKIQAGKTFSYQGHVLVTLYVQFLCSHWSKFDRWVHVENLCSILKLVLAAEADRILCQLFNCLISLDVQNEIQLLSRVFSYSWLVCLLFFFGWEMRRLSKSEIRFQMASFSFFALLDA